MRDPHQHVVNVNNNALYEQNFSKLRFVQVLVDPAIEREAITVNQAQNYRAFFSCNLHCHFYIEEIPQGMLFEVTMPSFSLGRPFDDLVWVSKEILVFDQWSQPHFGVHYALNIQKRELLLASPFTDKPQ